MIICCVQNKGLEIAEQLKRKATAAIPVSFHGHVKLHKRWSQSSAAELEVSRWRHGDETHCSLECPCRSLRHPRRAADRHNCLRISFIVHYVLFWTYKINIVPNQISVCNTFSVTGFACIQFITSKNSAACSSNNTSSAACRNPQQYTKILHWRNFKVGGWQERWAYRSDSHIFSPHFFRQLQTSLLVKKVPDPLMPFFLYTDHSIPP